MPESADILSELSNQYQLLYLEFGDEVLLTETKIRLAHEGFPEAPLLVWRMPGEGSGREEVFSERLKELRDAGWEGLRAGISRSVLDAKGFLINKMEAIVIVEENDDIELPEGAEAVTSWKDIPVVLGDSGVGPGNR